MVKIALALNSCGLDTLIQRVPDLVENAIAKGKTGNAIDLTLDNLVINDCKISMVPSGCTSGYMLARRLA